MAWSRTQLQAKTLFHQATAEATVHVRFTADEVCEDGGGNRRLVSSKEWLDLFYLHQFSDAHTLGGILSRLLAGFSCGMTYKLLLFCSRAAREAERRNARLELFVDVSTLTADSPVGGGGMVEELELRRYEGGVDGEGCSICLEAYEAGERVTRMPCSHEFHDRCLPRWMEKKHDCPLCRYEMPAWTYDVYDVYDPTNWILQASYISQY